MGAVSSERDLNVLKQRLHTLCSTHVPLDYAVTAPYWKEPLLTYIFLDVEPAESFRNFRVEMHDVLGNLIAYDDHGGQSPAHYRWLL